MESAADCDGSTAPLSLPPIYMELTVKRFGKDAENKVGGVAAYEDLLHRAGKQCTHH